MPVKAFIIPYNAHAAFKLQINNVEFVNKEFKFDNAESPVNASSFLGVDVVQLEITDNCEFVN